MPRHEAKFSVNAPPQKVWQFIRDIEALCACIPGVEHVRLLDAQTAELRVKEKVGVVPLVVDLTARIDMEEAPHRLHAIAKAEHLTMAIEITLDATGAGTELLGLIDVKGEGALKSVVDRLFERRASERAAQFAETLATRFGAGAPADAAREQTTGGWLRRFWKRLRAMLARPAA